MHVSSIEEIMDMIGPDVHISKVEKEQKFENDFGIRLTDDLRKGVSEMCNFGDGYGKK